MSEENLTPVSPKQLEKENSKLFKCSSGHVYRIRKMPLIVLADFMGFDFTEKFTEQLKDPVTASKFMGAIEHAIPICVIEPKVTIEKSPDSVALVDVPILDQIEIVMELISFSGFTEAKIKEFNKFRKKRPGQGGKKASRT